MTYIRLLYGLIWFNLIIIIAYIILNGNIIYNLSIVYKSDDTGLPWAQISKQRLQSYTHGSFSFYVDPRGALYSYHQQSGSVLKASVVPKIETRGGWHLA